VVSSFLKGYKADYNDDEKAPEVLIIIDSLDMLMTETEEKNYDTGKTKGDQGQRNKQLKAMLRTFVQDIKHLNVSMVVTSQVYRNQDLTNGEGTWVVSDAVKYSLSQIILLTKLKLRDDNKKTIVHGIRMKCEGYKTRFTQPFQNVEIHVPYETGIDPLSGMVEVATKLGIVRQSGSWYYIGETKFRGADISDHVDDILVKAETMSDQFIQMVKSDNDEDEDAQILSSVKKRKAKAGVGDAE
jgi:recombination protein RecA